MVEMDGNFFLIGGDSEHQAVEGPICFARRFHPVASTGRARDGYG